LTRSPLVTVRGPISQRMLQQNGFTDASIVGDPVLSLADRSPRRRRGRKIGINVGDTSGRLWGGNDGNLHDWIRSLIRRLLQAGFEVSLVSVYPKDTPVLRRIAREFPGRSEVLTLYSYGPKVLDTFRTFDLFVGEKLHSVVLAHCAYTPAVMLEYEPKCADYMASMGLESFNFRCDRLDLNTVHAALTSLLEESDAHQQWLIERVRHYQALQMDFAHGVRTGIWDAMTRA
jgi:polysaccharide pyruvyl transferase WcaK-like protein